MNKLFLDIETIPCADEHKDAHVEILKKRSVNGTKTDDQIHESMSFDGTFGRICCIGYIKESENGIEKDVLKGDEKKILQKFWDVAKDIDLFIGHNILGFDFPFIYIRSVVNGVKPTQNVSLAKYRSHPVYDTQKEWVKWSDNGPKLDTIAKVLKLPTSKDDMDGSMVWGYFKDGKIDEICTYCMKDVELTRKVYKRMTFQDSSTDAF